jgi:hypothetical protein
MKNLFRIVARNNRVLARRRAPTPPPSPSASFIEKLDRLRAARPIYAEVIEKLVERALLRTGGAR